MRPRIRTVKPEMRKDERYGRLSYPARELFNGLITMADDEGRFLATTSAILGHVFPYDEDAPRRLKTWVNEVKDSGMVLFYVAGGVPYGAFRHWRRHQKINRPTPSVLPPPPDPSAVTENEVQNHGSDHEPITADSLNGSLSAHGTFTPPRAGARSGPDPLVVERLSEKLAARVRANDPKSKPSPQSERWLTDMRLLLLDRDGDVAEVERVLDWCQSDPFWRSNILSPGKLRKQFTALLLRSAGPENVVALGARRQGGRRETASDWLNENMAPIADAQVVTDEEEAS